jgi:hypothetical protein
MTPHVFDHTPTRQEVFDEACNFFATSAGPSINSENDRNKAGCLYRGPEGRACVAGYFIPDDAYDSKMESGDNINSGSGISNIWKRYPDRLPAWIGDNLSLLTELQGTHDNDDCRSATKAAHGLPGWHHPELRRLLKIVADLFNLNATAIERIGATNA